MGAGRFACVALPLALTIASIICLLVRASGRATQANRPAPMVRFACVALPLALTIASIICLLVAMLGGVTDKNLGLFEIDTKDLSISSSSLENLIGTVTPRDLIPRLDINLDFLDNIDFSKLSVDEIKQKIKDAGVTGIGNVDEIAKKIKEGGKDAADDLLTKAKNSGTEAIDNLGINITAKDLNLADYYRVSLWGYCSWTDGKRECTKAKFDWASGELNESAYKEFTTSSGQKAALPKEVRGALKTFRNVSKWTQVVYIAALVTLAIELVCGIFAICSRIGSCCTVIVCSIATLATIIASILATVQASVVVGAVKAAAKAYSVDAHIITRYLGFTWAAVAFSLGAGLFWLFTMCCCASDSKSSKNKGFGRSRHSDAEKLIPGASRGYQRVGDDHSTAYHGQSNIPMHNVKPSRGSAYEPFSHRG